MTGLFLPPGYGHTSSMGGHGVVFKVDADQTKGALSIVEHPIPPGGNAGPPHTHSREDEVTYVIEGEINVLIGDDVIRAPAGSYVIKPRDIPHTFWNASGKPAHILEIITPAGLEKYFEEVSPAFKPGQPPDAEMIVRIAAKYGLKMHVERIGELAAKYGVQISGGPPRL